MTCLIYVLSHNRIGHLKLCLPRLLRSNLTGCSVTVLDDGSTDPKIADFLHRRTDIIAEFAPAATGTPQERIGIRRHDAVEALIASGADCLLLLDDDILVGPRMIQDGLAALNILTENLRHPVTLSFHGVLEPRSYVVVGPWCFGSLKIGGEANVLIPRAAVERVGNHFGPEPRGFGDLFFEAVWAAGLGHYEICKPDPQVQHLGFGQGASVAYPEGGTQQWTHRPYQRHGPPETGIHHDLPLQVEGFDLAYYCGCVRVCGGLKAPLAYLERSNS